MHIAAAQSPRFAVANIVMSNTWYFVLQQPKEDRDELMARIQPVHRYIFDRLTLMLGLDMSFIQESFLSTDQVSEHIETISWM